MGRKKKQEAPKTRTERTVIYLDLPQHKVWLKEVLEGLGFRHNRNLTGECLQALEEYARKHNAAPNCEEGDK